LNCAGIVSAAADAGLRIMQLLDHTELSCDIGDTGITCEDDGRYQRRADGWVTPVLFTLIAERRVRTLLNRNSAAVAGRVTATVGPRGLQAYRRNRSVVTPDSSTKTFWRRSWSGQPIEAQPVGAERRLVSNAWRNSANVEATASASLVCQAFNTRSRNSIEYGATILTSAGRRTTTAVLCTSRKHS
jgi:hypothetical protein